jgi:hypothetical protein
LIGATSHAEGEKLLGDAGVVEATDEEELSNEEK